MNRGWFCPKASEMLMSWQYSENWIFEKVILIWKLIVSWDFISRLSFRGNISGNSSCTYAGNNAFTVAGLQTQIMTDTSTLILSLRCHNEAPEVETLSEQGWVVSHDKLSK